jgi:hypothetical protein
MTDLFDLFFPKASSSSSLCMLSPENIFFKRRFSCPIAHASLVAKLCHRPLPGLAQNRKDLWLIVFRQLHQNLLANTAGGITIELTRQYGRYGYRQYYCAAAIPKKTRQLTHQIEFSHRL